jgi:biotin carboxylase
VVRNKDLARARLAAAGFRQPAFRLCADRAEAAEFLGSTTGPWVVKPRDGMGSEGVRKVSGPDELDAALAGLHEPGPFLVEEFVDGVEYSVEGLFLGGEPRVLAVTAKQVVDPPYFAEVGHVIPAPMAEAERAAATEQVEAALRVLGARFGVFHVELWLTGAGVVLGELHVRNGGDWIHRLLEHAIPGLQLYGLVYDDALGRPVDTAALTPTRGAAVRFLFPPAGTLARIEGWERVTAHPAVLHASLEVAPGDRIEPIHDSDTRAGAVIVGAGTPEEAAAIARQLVESVTFVVEG